MAHQTDDFAADKRRPKVLFIVNPPGFFCSHRLPIARAAMADGFDVAVACAQDHWADEIVASGARHIPLAVPRGFGGLLKEIRGFLNLFLIMRREKPSLVHLVTPKLLLLGGICSRILRIPTVAAVSGLGHVFIDSARSSTIVRRVLLLGLKFALRRTDTVIIFQNGSDRDVFLEARIAQAGRFVLIPGSGTDLDRFRPKPSNAVPPIVILPARLLKSKGIDEFAGAARELKRRGVAATFVLQGDIDPANPASADPEELQSWSDAGLLEVRAHRPDIENALQESDIVVLPSYREGFPKTLIDAAAAGLPAVTTNVPGCRDAVINGETGLLIETRDPIGLADAVAVLLEDEALRKRMGDAARRLAEKRYDINKIAANHLEIYRKIMDEVRD